MTKEWVIRDPVHGYIELSPQEVAVLDTRVVQRLRGIKQLANTHLVFPGATHTRFEHSLGTLAVASRMAARIPSLKGNAEAMANLRLAGLLHDLGHGPFSHVSEDIVARIVGSPKFNNVAIAVQAARLDEPLRSALGHRADAVLDLMDRGEKQSVTYDILDGPLDADKLDYLVRDSHYCGVPYGNPDTIRVLYTLREVRGRQPEETYLGTSEKGVEAVQALHIARYNMHRVVYNHKVRRIADAMVVRATTLAVTEDKTLDRRYFDFRAGDEDFLKAYLSLDDRELARRVTEGGKTAGDIMRCVGDRRLFKAAFVTNVGDLPALAKAKVLSLTIEQAMKLEEQISDQANVDRNYVIVDKQAVENPTYREPAGVPPRGRQILVDTQPAPKSLDEMPGIWGTERKFAVDKLWVFCRKEERATVAKSAAEVVSAL